MQNEVRKIIEDFERGAMPEEIARAELRRVTGRDIEPDWLSNYWRSESLDEFVDRLCAPPITDWQKLDDEAALALISEFIATNSAGRRDSIDDALSKRYGKPHGYLMDLVEYKNLSSLKMIMQELKKDARFYM